MVTVLWNQPVQPNRTIPNDKPDSKIRDNEKWTYPLIIIEKHQLDAARYNYRCMMHGTTKLKFPLIVVAISGEGYVIQIEARKILKYKDISLEIE